jgi:clan AA aspartic protease (TIGR02281 family)
MKQIISTTQRTPFRSNQMATPLYLDRDGRSVRVDVHLGSLTKRMLIDTGATGLSIPEWVAGRLLLRREAVEAEGAILTLANGCEERRGGVNIFSISIGGQVLRDVYATVAPDGSEALLGFPVLNQAGRFTIDTKAGVLIFG